MSTAGRPELCHVTIDKALGMVSFDSYEGLCSCTLAIRKGLGRGWA